MKATAKRHKYRFADRKAAEDAELRASAKALALGQCLRAMVDGSAKVETIKVTSLDGEQWEVRAVVWDGPHWPVVTFLYRFAGDGFSWSESQRFVDWCDTEVRQLGRNYAAFQTIGAWARKMLGY